MPAALLPILLAVGTTAATGAFSGGGGGSSDATAAATSQAEADAKKQAEVEAAQKAQAIRAAAPNAQAQVGGSLTDAPFASLTSNIAGMPSNLQDALKALGMNDPSANSQPGLTFSGGS
jgi:hypothetical protein